MVPLARLDIYEAVIASLNRAEVVNLLSPGRETGKVRDPRVGIHCHFHEADPIDRRLYRQEVWAVGRIAVGVIATSRLILMWKAWDEVVFVEVDGSRLDSQNPSKIKFKRNDNKRG